MSGPTVRIHVSPRLYELVRRAKECSGLSYERITEVMAIVLEKSEEFGEWLKGVSGGEEE